MGLGESYDEMSQSPEHNKLSPVCQANSSFYTCAKQYVLPPMLLRLGVDMLGAPSAPWGSGAIKRYVQRMV